MKKIEKELKAIYDPAKSFYKKASIINYYNKHNTINKTELKSYNTIICYLKDSKIHFNYNDINNKKIYSMTTLRHIKEFIKQKYYYLELNYKNIINKEKLTKKDIEKLINEGR